MFGTENHVGTQKMIVASLTGKLYTHVKNVPQES